MPYTSSLLGSGALTSGGVAGVSLGTPGFKTATTKISVTMAAINTARSGTTCNVKVCTLPAKTQLIDAILVVTQQAAHASTATISVGRAATGYIDYLTAQNFKVAANTIYGDASAERGTNLVGYDLPSYTATTDVYAQVLVGAASDLTAGTFDLILTTRLLP
jgi:hypothetical protein